MTTAQKISKLRIRRGWSQRALARALNEKGVTVSQRAVSGWEEGAEPRPEMLVELADLFGIDLELLRDASLPLPPPSVEEIRAAQNKPLPPELARPIAENLRTATAQLVEKAKNMPPGSTLGDMILIEELELMLNHAHGLVESLERLRSRLAGEDKTSQRKKKAKQPLIVDAPAHHRNPIQPAKGGGGLKEAV